MTNFEWLISERKDFLKDLLKESGRLAIRKEDGEVAMCHSLYCKNCAFCEAGCKPWEVIDWLEAEHQKDSN